MASHPVEEATVRTFVIAAKRDRVVQLLGSRKRRPEALDALNHFADWDERYAQPLAPSADVLEILRSAGAHDTCHVIADDRALDGRDLPLADALAAVDGSSFASVICCVPGRLALYTDESDAPRRRLLLRARAS